MTQQKLNSSNEAKYIKSIETPKGDEPKNKTEMNKEEKKQYLAQLNFCRSYLYLGGMLNEKDNAKVHERIKRYQDRNKINITPEEIEDVEFKTQTQEQ